MVFLKLYVSFLKNECRWNPMKKPSDRVKLVAGCKGPDGQGYLIWKFHDKIYSHVCHFRQILELQKPRYRYGSVLQTRRSGQIRPG